MIISAKNLGLPYTHEDVLKEYSVPNEYCDRKSFYGKAKIVVAEEGTFLRSYDTLVCCITPEHKFQKLWGGYSATTMRHINAFMKYLGVNKEGKHWWDNLIHRKEYDLADL